MRTRSLALHPVTVLLSALILAACSGEASRGDLSGGAVEEEPIPTGSPDEEDPAENPVLAGDTSAASFGIPGWQRLTEPHFGDLDEMLGTRIIRAAVVPSRTLFFMDGGQPRGITYDALSRFEDFLNERLESGVLRVHVVMIPMRRDRLFPALAEGRVDIAAANLTVTQERMATVDFSAPLLRNVSEILVTGPGVSAPATPDGLSGFEVHVRPSSSYFQSLEALNARLRGKGLAPVLVKEADELLEDEDLMEMVNAGIIPATVVDNLKAELWSQVFESITVHPSLALREGGEVAWAFRKGSPQLAALLRDFAREHRQGTLLGNMALRRYLGSGDRIVNPLDRRGDERLQEMLPVFEEYAERYEFDPLLLIAQGYQESRLNPEAVSPVGAVGVMQLMPSTAADPNVGIPDITGLEDNVHAGAKYLRFLLDHYFADAELNPLDEHLFAFAAYNAGATRVASLRSEAAEMGLDPDRWFQNVEHVAARRIGRETVQYVSNIYKYYLTYSRIEYLDGMGPAR